MPITEYKVYAIDEITLNNVLALLEEVQSNGTDPVKLFVWKIGEEFLIQQSIDDLKQLEEINEEFELCQ